ncbi:hypothetical protein [Ruegeria sp. HKCCD7318]|uniref:hypothetical protein n=1 Tax=Ruegeria sp. HKCCD7318 TaxID=2683014 RepID=UPI0014924CCF|nr:hypothetical protein [Ruegeria sp. HKCCD7318]NOE36324.1 hypothetical protein [Ruegeria sp. HKCCD7318]
MSNEEKSEFGGKYLRCHAAAVYCGVSTSKLAKLRMQANMSRGQYDVVTSDKIPDPVWPKMSLQEMIKIAFGNGHLIDRLDHPIIRQLAGE